MIVVQQMLFFALVDLFCPCWCSCSSAFLPSLVSLAAPPFLPLLVFLDSPLSNFSGLSPNNGTTVVQAKVSIVPKLTTHASVVGENTNEGGS